MYGICNFFIISGVDSITIFIIKSGLSFFLKFKRECMNPVAGPRTHKRMHGPMPGCNNPNVIVRKCTNPEMGPRTPKIPEIWVHEPSEYGCVCMCVCVYLLLQSSSSRWRSFKNCVCGKYIVRVKCKSFFLGGGISVSFYFVRSFIFDDFIFRA